MCCVCDVLYAVLYVDVNSGCAVSWRYLNISNSDMFSVVYMSLCPFEVLYCVY